MIFVQHPRHVSSAEVELWLREELQAIKGDGVQRVELKRLVSPTLRFSETWTWMVEVVCRDARVAHDVVRDGAGMMLLADLRLLGMRPSVALLEEAD
jgi:hypothetical protein